MPELGEHRWNTNKAKDEWWVICPKCGQEHWSTGHSSCFECFNKAGSKHIIPSGQVYIKLDENDPYYGMSIRLGTLGQGWVGEARHIMAQHLRRCLERSEIVLRRNRDKTDNRIENLILKEYPNRERTSQEVNE